MAVFGRCLETDEESYDNAVIRLSLIAFARQRGPGRRHGGRMICTWEVGQPVSERGGVLHQRRTLSVVVPGNQELLLCN